MNERQIKYLEKLFLIIINDIKIDYDYERVSAPWFSENKERWLTFSTFMRHLPSVISWFENYCRHNFGLDYYETNYLWERVLNYFENKFVE